LPGKGADGAPGEGAGAVGHDPDARGAGGRGDQPDDPVAQEPQRGEGRNARDDISNALDGGGGLQDQLRSAGDGGRHRADGRPPSSVPVAVLRTLLPPAPAGFMTALPINTPRECTV